MKFISVGKFRKVRTIEHCSICGRRLYSTFSKSILLCSNCQKNKKTGVIQ